MTTKRTGQHDPPAKAGDPKTHALVARAVPGDRQGLRDAYGHAGAWLKKGQAPPEELAIWVGDRLLAMANALSDKRDKNKDGVLAALHVTEPGKPGNKAGPKGKSADQALLVWDCFYERNSTDATWPEIFKRVAERCSRPGISTTHSQVETAWRNRREIVPDLPELLRRK